MRRRRQYSFNQEREPTFFQLNVDCPTTAIFFQSRTIVPSIGFTDPLLENATEVALGVLDFYSSMPSFMLQYCFLRFILVGFVKVSHKTCRFYFILEKTTTTLDDYLRRCLESDRVSEVLVVEGEREEGGSI